MEHLNTVTACEITQAKITKIPHTWLITGVAGFIGINLLQALLKLNQRVVGLTFTENCPNLRNTRVVDFVRELQDYGIQVDVHDPLADADEALLEYWLELVQTPQDADYHGIVLAVAHDRFKAIGASAMRRFGNAVHLLYDLKNTLFVQESDLRW